MQAFVVCERAREIKEQVGAHGVLMGGDLNSDPLSGAAQMIMNGVLGQEDASYQDCWKNLHKMVRQGAVVVVEEEEARIPRGEVAVEVQDIARTS